MPIIKSVTLRTIANELGLTVNTVSKALKGRPGMSEQTRHLIVQTAERLGYFTKEQIRSLKAEHILPYPLERKRFFLVQTTQSVSYYKLLLEGLYERFASFGHHIEVLLLPSSVKEKEMDGWLDQRGLAYTDGLFIAPSIMPREWEPKLLRLPVPKILLNFPPLGTRVDSVIWDIYEATYQAVAYLRSIGHTNIMYVGDTTQQRGYILRWQAFLHAMNEFGARVDPDAHSIRVRTSQALWKGELSEKLARYAPTAILCGIEGEVPEVYRLCSEQLGLRIPEDLSIIGLLNQQPDSLPPFTMPLLAIRETGYRAADRMLWRIANPSLPYEHIRIQGELKIGSTTASLEDRAATVE
ncbi:LacI family DNA-binding transcriptional regulator [Paenibacillus oceani]|uniref:LacI family DNA-binding transcriptional regulator n=1 Tax=Paenibacillus oceani TaxID=2772510 RepID=A0A927CGS8_9BACL|nr:LacI family DNA-binding transcriptional regulator [Paenibacillus oceani]MBD2866317.1 LacI family DNA-binding transcriptional regulator [Paenibacillus oceani]